MLVLKYLPSDNILAKPDCPEDFAAIFRLRWLILRKPWNQPEGSEQDLHEYSAVQRAICKDENPGEVLASGRLQATGELSGQIRYMAVRGDLQGKGLGSVILRSLEDEARAMGLSSVFLNARQSAVDFYLRFQYRLEQEIDPFLGIRHFRMSKLLF